MRSIGAGKGVPYTWFDPRFEVGFDWAVGVTGLAAAIAARRRMVALFELPKRNRAMDFTDNVVSRRSRTTTPRFIGGISRRAWL